MQELTCWNEWNNERKKYGFWIGSCSFHHHQPHYHCLLISPLCWLWMVSCSLQKQHGKRKITAMVCVLSFWRRWVRTCLILLLCNFNSHFMFILLIRSVEECQAKHPWRFSRFNNPILDFIKFSIYFVLCYVLMLEIQL